MSETSKPSRASVLSLGTVVIGSAFLLAQMPAPDASKKSGDAFKNVQVLQDVPSDQLIPSMKFIASALGVRCEYCHVENAFDKDDKQPKQIARKMMRMMFAINQNNFSGKQEVTCNSCHRGSPTPVAIPIISDATPHPLNAQAAAVGPNPPDLPKPDEIVQKYITAMGGEEAISKAKTLAEHASANLGGREFQEDIFIKSPTHIATVTHFPGGAIGIVAWDGSSGFMSFPGAPIRQLSPGDRDAARMDADLQFALDLKTFFAEVNVVKKAAVGDKEAILVIGRRAGLPDVEMYFDLQTGLITRMVRYEASALGLNPTQVDYSDYRNTGGVKIPFHWVSAAPTGSFSVQVSRAEPNAAVNDALFERPAAANAP